MTEEGKITNPVELTATLVFHDPDGEPSHVDVVKAEIHYGTQCEHGSHGRKGAPVPMTPTMLNSIKDFFEEAIEAANVAEGYASVAYGAVEWLPEPEPEETETPPEP